MKTAFSSFVFGDYERFIPYYIYSINKTYPESDIVIFFQGSLSASIKKITKFYPNTVIHERFYSNKLNFKKYKIKNGGGIKLLRFLIPKDYFKAYDYVYFGDIDIVILNEAYSLFDFHREQISKSNVPFSNKVRTLPEGGLSKRLTGLHFVEVNPYFEKTQPIIDRILQDEDYRNNFLHGIKRDEQLLYKLNKEAFDFDEALLSRNSRPWHGFHLGLVRGKDYLNTQTVLENSSISIDNLKNQMIELNKDGAISKLLLEIQCIEVYYTYKYLGLFLPFEVKLKYELIKQQNKSQKLWAKIKRKFFNG